MRQLALLLLIVWSGCTYAQDTLVVVDGQEPLPYASVSVMRPRAWQQTADTAGRVVLPPNLADGERVRVDYLGYETLYRTIGRLREGGFVFQLGASSGTTLASPTVIGRRDEAAATLPYQVESIDQQAIARTQSLTTADALADLSGVYVQKSQFGGGSPVIRGFEANRVLLVVDGVRMNNAIFRNGHLQNAITVDPLALERLELIYGAGALAYGSDAIGGVVHFRTREPGFLTSANKEKSILDPPTDQSPWSLHATLSYSSAARHFGQSLRAEYRAHNFASLTLLSTTFTSHLRAGAQKDDRYPNFGLRSTYVERIGNEDIMRDNPIPERQIGTAYQQYNLLQKFRFRLQERLELSANFQFSTSSNVPRYDALTETRNDQPRWARWDYGPQTRALASLKLKDRRPTLLYDLATYLLSHQFVEEDRLQRRFNDPLEENNLAAVHASNLQIDFIKDLSFLRLRYGFDLRHDQVSSTAFLRDLRTNSIATAPVASRYPSQGSSLSSGGFYAEANRRLGYNWRLRGGLRYNYQRLSARFGAEGPIEWPAAYLTGINNAQGALTAAIGLKRNWRDHSWRVLLAQGFRAPNIDDFAKFRENNGFIQVPNPDLRPERSLTLESGYRYQGQHNPFHFGLTAYYTWLNQAIIRSQGILPDGSSSFISRGEQLFAQTNVNADRARVYGLDVDFFVRMAKDWQFRTEFHYLRGVRKQAAPGGLLVSLPQDHIPPAYGKTRLGWQKKQWELAAVIRYQLAKQPEDYAVGNILVGGDGFIFDRLGTADNLELTPQNIDGDFVGSLAWWTANLYASMELNDRWEVRLKAENLLDRHYRTFASGVSAPGRNLGLSIAGQLR